MIAVAVLVVVIILGIIAAIVPGWTRCTHEKESWHVGPFRTSHDGNSEGTLYMWDPLPCPHDEFKIPVNLTRMFLVSALLMSLFAIIVLLLGQAGVWKTLVLVKSSAMCCFASSLLFLLTMCFWTYASIGDVDCSDKVTPINPYGPAGWCDFNYAWYFIWICMIATAVIGGIIMDWFGGLPWKALLALAILAIVQLLVSGALMTNKWFSGEVQQGAKNLDTWGGLWRVCQKQDQSTNPNALEHTCGTVEDWNHAGSRDCMKKSIFHAVRGLTIGPLIASVFCYVFIFAAHAYRRAALGRIPPVIAVLMTLFWAVALAVWLIRINEEHNCRSGNITSFKHLPYCDPDKCGPGFAWALLLVATILSLVLAPLLWFARVGFEEADYLDHSPRERRMNQKPPPVVDSVYPSGEYHHEPPPAY
eukprot:NODE_426_length_1515_cov_127.228386_g394_i0.p1 GENE.NODE_426_length_1515_cov_127.228386_g394_i0~~NODE_426_length_1515_cov_127.228386_g394_i0.p1  ORF type:complete len:468 (+),score=64.82 NODE_426_length_1515_cov_127.228386_g394_i0:152-1405(+)